MLPLAAMLAAMPAANIGAQAPDAAVSAINRNTKGSPAAKALASWLSEPTAASDTTAAVGVVAAGDTIAAGNAATLSATVTGGTAPYSLTWLNGLHEVVATATLDTDGTATVSYVPSECDDYYVTVTDADGSAASDTCRVVVTGDAVAATMENLWLDDESAWAGPDTKGEAVTGVYGDSELAGSFVSGSYSFSNCYSLDWGSWSGFAYSNCTSTDYATLDDQYNSAAGGGHNGSPNYAVGYSDGTIRVLNNAAGDTIRGMYVTNTAYAVNSIVNGDSYSSAFSQGSYLTIVFTGTHADGTVDTLTCHLADYTGENEADHYYLDTWQWVDLRGLGSVTELGFYIDGSDKSWGYLNTPAYFCLDDVNGTRDITVAETQTSREVALAGLFSFESGEASVSYALPDAPYDGTEGMATITDNGILELGDDVDGSFSLLVSATQRGKTQFVQVPFDVSTGIEEIGNTDASSNTEVARYDMRGVRLDAAKKGVNIVRMKDGSVRKVVVK